MKKLHVLLTLLAFLGAGVGVFATAVQAEKDFATSYRVNVNSPCDTVVQNDDCSTGQTICKVRSGPNLNKQIHMFDDQTQECTPLFKP